MKRLPALLLLLVACGQKAPELKPPFTFALYGDCRGGHDVNRTICRQIAANTVKFIVHTGDCVADGNREEDWAAFREATREVRPAIPFFAAKGNHDQGSKGLFEKEFQLDRTWYDRRLGNVHLFFLDTNADIGSGEQLHWLEQRAQASDATHKIAVFHHPPFSLMPSRQGESEGVRRVIHRVLVDLKFCAAFCGHDHHFYTTLRDGVRYIVTGGGGAPLYALEENLAKSGDLWYGNFHFLLCVSEEKKLSASVRNLDGQEIPKLSFTICEHP